MLSFSNIFPNYLTNIWPKHNLCKAAQNHDRIYFMTRVLCTCVFSSWNPSRKLSNSSSALSIRSAYSPMIQIMEALQGEQGTRTHIKTIIINNPALTPRIWPRMYSTVKDLELCCLVSQALWKLLTLLMLETEYSSFVGQYRLTWRWIKNHGHTLSTWSHA